MINLSLNDIRKVSHDLSFKRGAQYYQNRLVGNIVCDLNSIKATVNGTKPYEVQLRFQPGTGQLNYYACSCPAFSPYSGACKHVVATLFEVLYMKEKINASFEKGANDLLLKAFYDALHQDSASIPKNELKLEVSLEIINKDNVYLSLRIGYDKLYVLKDFAEFLSARNNGRILHYGQKFSYDPTKHVFNEIDEEIIQVLSEYYDAYHFIKPTALLNSDVQFQNKFHLPDSYLKRILVLLEKKPFIIRCDGHEIIDTLVMQNLDLQFSVVQDSRSIDVHCPQLRDYITLTKDSSYVFYDWHIYKLTKEQVPLFNVVTKHITRSKPVIRFDLDNKAKFILNVLPVINSLGTVDLEEKVKDDLIIEPLKIVLYIDKHRNTIKGRVDFCYGPYKIGIYPPSEPELEEGKIIVRDEKKESSFLSLLHRAGCQEDPSDSTFTIHDEEALYTFIFEYLPKLQKLSEVYYSEDFKNLHVRAPITFKASVRLNDRSDMLEFSFDMEDLNPKELAQMVQALQEKKKYYRLQDGRYLKFDETEIYQVADLLKQLNVKGKDFKTGTVELHKYHAFAIDNFVKANSIQLLHRDTLFDKLIEDIKNPDNIAFEIPDGLNATLRNYQKIGYQWFRALSHYQFGGILADDMGLGKTLQAIALLKSSTSNLPSLVVAPTSLVFNWEDEIHKFAPDMKALVITGNKDARDEALTRINDYKVVITSYGLLKRDLDNYLKITFEYCFLDEAQHIKNPNSQNAKSVKRIQSKHRFALTGTPIENSLTELWSIFDFIMPGYLSTHAKFMAQYERPIVKEEDQYVLSRLTNQIKPFVLRRLKTDVLKELPPKIETKVSTELTDKQKKLYVGYLEKVKTEIRKDISIHGYQKSTMKILSALTRLRQICCHPALFSENYNGTSSKLELLEELVTEAIESGHRILIFSQFTGMLHLIEKMLISNEIRFFYLDGSTPAEERRDMVHQFNAGINEVFLISLKAGGTGLNLTGADMVIHYDPWWNPAAEDQATDRAYRIGQDKPVQVMKLLTTGTIEEKIYQLQLKKKTLIESVIQPGETLINKLTEEEVLMLFE